MYGFGTCIFLSWVTLGHHVGDNKRIGVRQGLKTRLSVPKRHDLKGQASPTSFRGQQNLTEASSILLLIIYSIIIYK